MKRALLIAGGTVGGIGAVLSITPPHLNSQGMTGLGVGSAAAVNAVSVVKITTSPSPTATAAPLKRTAKKEIIRTRVVARKAAPRKVATTAKRTKRVAHVPTTKKTIAQALAPTPTKTVAPLAPVSKGPSGTFTGSAINVDYGIVQVQITVVDGKITQAQAIQAPTGRSGQYSTMALPILRQETLVAQSSKIQGVSGASYTSYGWYTSLVAALAKAGM
jgi:uncharacterized protein with FMN-binding domain